jgi:hypothetical protein
VRVLDAPPASCTAGVAAAGANPGAIFAAGWSWLNPLPFGYGQTGVWAAAQDDVWTAGAYGSVLHCGLTACTPVESATTAHLSGIWGAASNDVWAVGASGAIVHWDGSNWSAVPSPTALPLAAVGGTGTTDVWATGACGAILHWDGSAWSERALDWGIAQGASLWVAARDDVWVLGPTAVLHDQGGCWTDVSAEASAALVRARTGTGPPDASDYRVSFERVSGSGSDVWVTASVTSISEYAGPSVVVRWNGHGWDSSPAAVATPPYSRPLDTWPRDWSARLAWEATTSDAKPTPPDGWTVGGSPDVARYAAGAATPLTQGFTATSGGLWGFGPNDLRLVDSPVNAPPGQIRRFHGATWTLETTGLGPRTSSDYGRSFVDLWGSSPSDLWAVGDRIVAHFDGASWSALADETGLYRSVWGTSASDVWAVGSTGIGHWDGSSWTVDSSTSGLWLEQVAGSSATSVWAVGHTDATWGTGVILRWDGAVWTRVDPSPTPLPLVGVTALPDGEAWAVGGGVSADGGAPDSVILHFNGSAWQTETLADHSPTPWVSAVWASSAGEVWAGSERILKRGASGWSDVSAPPGLAIRRIWGAPGAGMWVADGHGLVLHYSPP